MNLKIQLKSICFWKSDCNVNRKIRCNVVVKSVALTECFGEFALLFDDCRKLLNWLPMKKIKH